MTRITVLTPTYKDWPVLRLQAEALGRQTFPREDVLWVVVDDLYAQRKGNIESPVRLIHVPPRVLREEADMCGAMNTGLQYAEGELVLFCVDYIVPQPGVLARHWDLYERYGPKVLISGSLRMASLQDGALVPEERYFTEREGPWAADLVRRDTAIVPTETDEGVQWVHRCAWMGRNDSAPLDAVVAANGFDERFVGSQGGDPELAIRLLNAGCDYVLDGRRGDAECWFVTDHVQYPGYGKKRVNGISYFEESRRTNKTVAENGGWSLAAAREQGGAR